MKKIKPTGQPAIKAKTADIYHLDEHRVLKLFHRRISRKDIETEALIASEAYAVGVPSPQIDEEIYEHTDSGRNGLVFARVNGETMLDHFIQSPGRMFEFARQFAQLHFSLHQNKAGEKVPSQREKITESIRKQKRIDVADRLSILAMLKELPDGEVLCHGDLHPGNVMMADSGTVIIDWVDGTRGNPLCDVARSSVLMQCSHDNGSWLYRKAARLVNRLYLKEYSEHQAIDQEQFNHWVTINAAIRIRENIPYREYTSLRKLVKRGLKRWHGQQRGL